MGEESGEAFETIVSMIKGIVMPQARCEKDFCVHSSPEPHVLLNENQIKACVQLRAKLDTNVYQLEKVPCLCNAHNDTMIAQYDRYGLPFAAVICHKCGLVRLNPRLDRVSLGEFYQKEYRDLYMGEEYRGVESYFNGMVRRGMYIKDCIEKAVPSFNCRHTRVLEIGCSAGGILLPFLDDRAQVKGYDYDQRYLAYGNQKNPLLHLNYGGIETLEKESATYDLIIINHVLEHIADPYEAMAVIRARLNEGGILYIAVPGLKNHEFYFSPTKSFLGSLHVAHLYLYSPKALARITKGFSVLYIDDAINAVLQKSIHQEPYASASSEYYTNIAFIKQYEQNALWKIRRLLFRFCERYSKGIYWRFYKLKRVLSGKKKPLVK